jgi:hypothetical protein
MEQQSKVLYQYFQLTESLEQTLERLEFLRVRLAGNLGPDYSPPAWHATLEEILLTVLDLVESDSLSLMQDAVRPEKKPALTLVDAPLWGHYDSQTPER